MKTRLLVVLSLALATLLYAAADKPVPVTTVKKSAIAIGNGSFALVKGTKLEVIGREGDHLIVKFRSTQGKIPLTDTDYDPETPLPEPVLAVTPPKAVVKPAVPAPAAPAATPAVAPTAKAAIPPALSVDGKPASTYGKAVQKAKQVEQAHKEKLVQTADEILDEKPKQ